MSVVAKIIIYPIFALVTFVVFLTLLFPYGSLKDKLEAKINEGLGDKYELSIGDFTPRPFSKVRLKNVSLVSLKSPGKIEVLAFDALDVDVSLFPLIVGTVNFEFEGKHKKSALLGAVSIKKSQYSIRLNMKDFNIIFLNLLKDMYGLGVEGQVSGKVDLDVYLFEPLRNRGDVDIRIHRLKVAESNVMNILDLPAMDLASTEDSQIRLVISNGNIQVQRFSLSGSDFDLSLKGKIYFSRRLPNYRLNLRGKFLFPATITPQLPFLLLIDSQKSADGSYPLTITGRLSKPNVQIGEFKLPI